MDDGNKLINRFLEFTVDKQLAVTGDKILLAVSGGLDSVVMSSLYAQSTFEFGIAHCNFSLRGEESDADELYVKGLAIKLNKQFHIKRFDTESYASQNKISIQEAARELRYQWFNELCDEHNYNKIATAHHLNDSIETFFINLLRGTGPAGLRGIPVVNKNIIRPLLFAKRSEIEEYADRLKIEYRTDSSNQSDDYTRNKIRHQLIPLLAEMSDNFEETMRGTFDDFTFINETMHARMEEWKKIHASNDVSGNIILPLTEIRNSKNSYAFLSALLYSYGITGVDCKKILAVEMPGKIFHSSKYLILRDRENLILQKKSEAGDQNIEVSNLPASFDIGNMKVSLSTKLNVTNNKAEGDKMIQQVDAEKVNLPLVMRTWQEGDYFFPLGMKGKKKISDFYTDQKLNRFEKDKTYLLLSGNDIVCILGHRIDERFKITTDTKKILSIELSEK